MLQKLRERTAGWVAGIFMGVLALSFAMWGIADIFRGGGGGQNAAEVGDRTISVEAFRGAYANELRRIGQQAKRVITPEQARIAGIGERVLGNLVNEAAVDARVSTLGLTLSDDEVAKLIRDDEIFRGPTGQFDRATFDEILRSNNLSENDYIRLQRQFSARKQLTDALSANIAMPTAMRQAIHAYDTDSRSISFLTLKPEAASAVPAPSPEALKSYYDEQKASFRAPEYRKLAVLAVDADAIAARQDIPETELRAYYDANRPQFADLERRSVEQISYPTFAEAQTAYDQIKAGGLFEQAMLQRKMKPEDAFLGDLTKAQMVDQKIAAAAFALEQGKVSPPVEGNYATVLLRVTGVQKEQVKDFAAVRDQIRASIAGDRAKGAVAGLHDKIDEQRLGGATLEEIAKTQNLQLRVVDAIDSAGRTQDGKLIDDLPQSSKLLTKAFETEQGADADAIVSGDSYLWFDVRGVTPGRERSFEEARADVERRWRDEEVGKRLDARAASLLTALKGGKSLDDVASTEKLEVAQAETTRSGGAPSISQGQATAVFQAPVEGFGLTSAEEDGSRLVFRVTSENIRPFDPNSQDGNGQGDRIAKSMEADVISAFVQKIRQDLGTRFNPGAIAQVTGGGAG